MLARLIDDLRTLSLSEVGVLRLHREPTDLARLIEEVVAGHRAAADEAGVTIAVDGAGRPADCSRWIRPASGRWSATSSPTRCASRRATAACPSKPARMRMARGFGSDDTGPGIGPEELDHVFDRFYRSPGSSGQRPRPADRPQPGRGARGRDLDPRARRAAARGPLHTARGSAEPRQDPVGASAQVPGSRRWTGRDEGHAAEARLRVEDRSELGDPCAISDAFGHRQVGAAHERSVRSARASKGQFRSRIVPVASRYGS